MVSYSVSKKQKTSLMSSLSGKGMWSKYFVVEYGSTLRHSLEETFKIQRIKFTSYNASKHYIVFGANIGSLYVYHLENISKCVKVLPNSFVQPVILISISPNEGNILFVDETGLIVIFEKCFSEKPYDIHIFNQQKGKKITAVQWEGNNKAYIGNSEGTIAVISIKSKLIFSLLHTPYVSLMDLHSRVIQIDIMSPLLLVTTDKKTFICHTEQERFKQVGTQETARGFGACFVYNARGVTLYCSRPGLRLWQANTEGDVFSTQKYKGVNPIIGEILKFGEGSDACLEVEKINDPEKDKANFGKVHLFGEKFLCIINSENIYIVDPEERNIIFHYYSPQSMDVKLIGKKILIRFSSGKFLILKFFKFEELMNEIYFKKQYSEGIQLLLRNREYALEWLKQSLNVKLITNFELKLPDVDKALGKQFTDMLNEFREHEKERLQQYLQDDDPKIINLNYEVEQTMKEQLCEELELMCKKYDLFKTCNIIYMPQFSKMLLNMNEDEMAKLFFDFVEYKKSKFVDIEMNWCYQEYIHHFDLKKGYKKLHQLKQETLDFLKESYLNVEAGINIESCSNSSCIYPLPSSKKGLPKYDKVGKALVKYCEDNILFVRKPYLWFHRLSKITTEKCLKNYLPVILQFGYISILQNFKEHITYNFCYDLVKLFIELKRGRCLNCGTPFSEKCSKYIPKWDDLGFALIPLVGSDNVLRIFSDLQQHIPTKDTLSRKFYLTCVFSEIQTQDNSAKKSIEMAVNCLSNSKTQSEFRDCLSAFLMGKLDKTHNAGNTIIKKELTCCICCHCEGTLQHPVFKQVIQLECGHAFHAICLELDNNICIICTPNQ